MSLVPIKVGNWPGVRDSESANVPRVKGAIFASSQAQTTQTTPLGKILGSVTVTRKKISDLVESIVAILYGDKIACDARHAAR